MSWREQALRLMEQVVELTDQLSDIRQANEPQPVDVTGLLLECGIAVQDMPPVNGQPVYTAHPALSGPSGPTGCGVTPAKAAANLVAVLVARLSEVRAVESKPAVTRRRACPTCNTLRSRDAFRPGQATCAICEADYLWEQAGVPRPPKDTSTRVCKVCGKTGTREDYYPSVWADNGRTCRACQAARDAKRGKRARSNGNGGRA